MRGSQISRAATTAALFAVLLFAGAANAKPFDVIATGQLEFATDSRGIIRGDALYLIMTENFLFQSEIRDIEILVEVT